MDRDEAQPLVSALTVGWFPLPYISQAAGILLPVEHEARDHEVPGDPCEPPTIELMPAIEMERDNMNLGNIYDQGLIVVFFICPEHFGGGGGKTRVNCLRSWSW